MVEALSLRHSHISISKRGGRIGITCANVPGGNGVRITGLLAEGVGAAAGLNVGDLILAINGELIRSHQEAIRLIDDTPEMIDLTLFGKTRRLAVDRNVGDRLGISIGTVSSGVGVEVRKLDPLGCCAACGLGVGQVILSINGEMLEGHERAIELLDHCGRYCELVIDGSSRLLKLDKRTGFVGLTVADHPEGRPGVVVISLAPSSLAIHAGIQLGDVIRSINHEMIYDHSNAIQLVDAPVDELALVLDGQKAELGEVLTAVSSPVKPVIRPPSFSRPSSARHFIASKLATTAREPLKESRTAVGVPYMQEVPCGTVARPAFQL